MKTKVTGFAVLSMGLMTMAACPDPGARFDEFEDRVPDAGSFTMPDAPPLDELPDVTGSWYVTYAPSPAPDSTIHFIYDMQLTNNGDGTGMLSITSTALDHATRLKAGDPVTISSVPVNKSGEFPPTFHDLILPGVANPLTGNQLELEMVLSAVIKDADFWCGTALDGSTVVVPPVGLAGTTFPARRIHPGNVGDMPPAPVYSCPE